jgi:hypothetical protein
LPFCRYCHGVRFLLSCTTVFRYILMNITITESRGIEKACRMPTKIRSQKLTTCHVAQDGANVSLEFIDSGGTAVTVELSIDQAEAVVMTLPHLLGHALRRQTGDEDARYVFGLRGWSIEGAENNKDCLIVTLTTTGGFEACFGLPLEACRSLGWALQGCGGSPAGNGNFDGAASPRPAKLN